MTSPPALPSLPVIPLKGGNVCITAKCSACCLETEMLLTESDVRRIRSARPNLDFFFQAPDGHFQLKTRDEPGRPCVFLSAAGRCTIHEIRPEGCRLYPAVWDSATGRAHLDNAHCPHTSGFVLAPATQDAVRRLAARLEREAAERLRTHL